MDVLCLATKRKYFYSTNGAKLKLQHKYCKSCKRALKPLLSPHREFTGFQPVVPTRWTLHAAPLINYLVNAAPARAKQTFDGPAACRKRRKNFAAGKKY